MLWKYKLLSFDIFPKFKTACMIYKVYNELTTPPLNDFIKQRAINNDSTTRSTQASTRGDGEVPPLVKMFCRSEVENYEAAFYLQAGNDSAFQRSRSPEGLTQNNPDLWSHLTTSVVVLCAVTPALHIDVQKDNVQFTSALYNDVQNYLLHLWCAMFQHLALNSSRYLSSCFCCTFAHKLWRSLIPVRIKQQHKAFVLLYVCLHQLVYSL